MKSKVLAGMLLSAVSLSAEDLNNKYKEFHTIIPYTAILNYDSDSKKDHGIINGIYLNTGNMGYMMEFDYLRTKLKYKSSDTEDLLQDEGTILSHKYWKYISLKLGLHTNSTSDEDLQNGNTFIGGIANYYNFEEDKFTLGVDYYHSIYVKGKDLDDNNKTIIVRQVTPYISLYNKFTSNFSNKIEVKANFEYIPIYSENKKYVSYEFKDKITYWIFNLEMKYLIGTFRTGVLNSGMVVYNSKDLIKKKMSAKIGIDLIYNTSLSIMYGETTFDEYKNDNGDNIKNRIGVATFSYKF